jgi:hypothetical protein
MHGDLNMNLQTWLKQDSAQKDGDDGLGVACLFFVNVRSSAAFVFPPEF